MTAAVDRTPGEDTQGDYGAGGRDLMRSARDIISWILIIAGIAILLFSMLWWTLAVNRLTRFPEGIDLTVECEGTVEKVAGRHGLEMLLPTDTEDLELSRNLSSVDDEYTSGTAVVSERVTQSAATDLGLRLDESNTYVMDRHDCANIKSDLSTSSGAVVDRSGSWTVNFPLGTARESYNIFNNDVASSFAVNYKGKEEIEGVGVYVFSGSFRHRPMVEYRVKARGLPLVSTFGEMKMEIEAMGVPLDQMIDTAYRTLTPEEKEAIGRFPDDKVVNLEYTEKHSFEVAVEPVTGTVVDVRKYEMRIFVNTEVRAFLPLLEILASHSEDPLVLQYMSQIDQQKVLEPKEIYRVSYHWTPGSVQEMTDYANSRIGPIRFARDYVTVMMLVLGAAAFIAGLVVRRERDAHADRGDADTEPGEDVDEG